MNRKIEKRIRKKGKKKRLCLSILVLIMLLFVPLSAYASEIKSDGKTTQALEEENKTVRVGYFPYANFQEGGYGEHKQGAGYEYLQKISYITGWKYEYVYGSFKECLDMLADGEIDILGSVSYTPERAESIDFSTYAEGTERYWIYTREDHTNLTNGDPKQMNGCCIGVADGSYQKELLEKWLDSNQIQAEVVVCKGYDEMIEKLDADELDALVVPALSVNSDFIAIANIGASDCYFGVSKSRPELLKELNSAMEEINNTETDYSSKLYARYEGKAVINYVLNKEEKQWLDAHEKTIRVGYLKDNLPFCGEENGKLTGILGTVLDTVQEKYKITIKAVPCSTGVEMNEALQSGKIDIAGPIIQDFYTQEQFQVVLTDEIFDITPVVIYKGNEYTNSLSTIAATETSLYSKLMVSRLFPDAEIKLYDTQEECLEAVANGKVGATVIPSSKINLLNESSLTKSLSFAEMAKRQELAMFTTRENRRAATIINKAIEQSSNILNGVVLAQNSVSEKKMTLQDVLAEYAGLAIVVSFVIIFVLLLLVYSLSVSRKKQMEALKEAQDANAANIAKTTFLNHMSHDIRTPMNAIVGFTDIAMKRKPDKEVENCLKKIRQSSEYLMTLINDVLDISRIESGKLEYKPIPVDLRDMINTVLSIARGYIENRDLNLYVSREELKTPYAMADELRIREVLLNIISNAIKFTKDGGTISFVAENCPGNDEHHVIVRYRISDTGIGNLVFMRKINSRILFEQMLGRATRICHEIGKTHFNIFDAVRVYEDLDSTSGMKSVSVSKTMPELLEDLFRNNGENKQQVKDRILARLQRKNNNLTATQKYDIIERLNGVDLKSYIKKLKSYTENTFVKTCVQDKDFLLWVDLLKREKKGYYYSAKPDILRETTRGYGNTEKPEDYLEAFAKFVNENKDKIEAIRIACTKPSDMTRAQLKELKLTLDKKNFTETNLNEATSSVTNVHIVADIIAYVRQAVLKTPIFNHDERVTAAFDKLTATHHFNKIQLDLLNKIKTYMLHESILNTETFEAPVFKMDGGFDRFNKKFGGTLVEIIREINTYIYEGVA
ncbi:MULTISPECIES: type I restriction-modification enzyme R subunit C-terminal domain-containing protein [unclassified Blautia]|uniref:type I restriction-modification enzyme R subunit C-terminal domain-containing protein n=1 Tax=unclassified Blautia TaxID=2648079 RepID=UPI001FD328D2|nr:MULTISPECIES: transporter substrate-binding domain-containing protein [unclassified Blautia]MCJ7861083.1 transporter substrate-binding domain-containing protein [Blautia sp. NSJ-157]MCJ7864898.1 transporter substrate-binding domain-containing protein [Blautia sp. NSJ-140]